MKVKIEYTVEVSDDQRRGINVFYGHRGLATRDEVKDWFRAYGNSANDDLVAELDSRSEATGVTDA